MLNLIQVTDSHLFADTTGCLKGANCLAGLKKVVADCLENKPRPDLVLATGDLSHDGSAASYQHLRRALSRLQAPVAYITGNHDDLDEAASILPGDFITQERSIRMQSWQVVLLQTAVKGQDGGFLPVEELAFADEMLQSWPEHHTLICLHHPPVSIGCSWLDEIGLENADEFFEVADRFPQVRGILFGHIHQCFESERNGVQLIGSPASCVQFMPGQDSFALDDQSPGYRWLSLEHDGSINTGVKRIHAN